MPVHVSCPYCNAVVAVESPGRVACPRCQEAFDSTTAEQLLDDTVESATPIILPQSGFLYSRSALLLSFGLAFLILVVGLATIRPWEPRNVPRKEIPLPVVVSPLGLSGLVYLPPTTNIVAAIQPLPLLAFAAQSKTDPRKFLIESGVPELVFANLDKAGVPLDQIDHLVIGVSISSEVGKILPGLTACLKLTRPIKDEDKFLTQLKAEKNSQQSKGGRTVYSIPFGLPLLLTKVDEQTYLFGLSGDDYAFLDKPHAGGGVHLPKELREAMTNRISPASFVWLATDSEKWTEKPMLAPFLKSAEWKERLAKLATLRAVAGGLSLEPEPQLRFATRWTDATNTKAFQERLKNQFKSETAIVAGDEGWATVQAPFDPKSGSLKSLLLEWLAEK